VRLISDLEAAESRIGSGQASPSGVVRVSAAPAFSRLYVVPQLPTFRVRYPKVVVESLVSERTINLVEEGIDLAIRNGALADSSLIARKIGEFAVIAVASADYLERKGEPTRLSDLDRHDGVIFVSQNEPRPWTFASRTGVISYQAAASFRSNDGEQQRAAVLAGLGITQAPYWLFAADIRAGTVRRILRDREPARIPISAVRPASRRQPSKVAVFVDFLAELLAETDD
jgi:LysR family transcriptional regulator for bpeEF and oprC